MSVESCVFQGEEPEVLTEKHEHLAYTPTWPTTNILPKLLLIVQTRSPCRIISIERKMEERNNMFEQMKRRKISVEDDINMEERNNILEKLNRPLSRDGWALKDASEDMKRDRDIVMTSVKQNRWLLQLASENLQRDREIVMAAVNQSWGALEFASDNLKRDR